MTTIHFITGLLTFYQRGEISKDEDFIYLVMPNSILGFIPLGKTYKQLMVNQVVSTSIGLQLILRELIVGVAEIVLGVLLRQYLLICLFMIVIGVITAIGAFQTILTFHLTSGERIVICFLLFENSKAHETAKMINKVISNRMNDANNRKVVEWETEQLRNISNS